MFESTSTGSYVNTLRAEPSSDYRHSSLSMNSKRNKMKVPTFPMAAIHPTLQPSGFAPTPPRNETIVQNISPVLSKRELHHKPTIRKRSPQNNQDDSLPKVQLPRVSEVEREMEQFPETFSPRETPDMSHYEKVDKWLEGLPLCVIPGTDKYKEDIWLNNCYSGRIPTSSNESESIFIVDESIDQFIHDFSHDNFVDQEDMLQYQARLVSIYATKMYRSERRENTARADKELVNIAQTEMVHPVTNSGTVVTNLIPRDFNQDQVFNTEQIAMLNQLNQNLNTVNGYVKQDVQYSEYPYEWGDIQS